MHNAKCLGVKHVKIGNVEFSFVENKDVPSHTDEKMTIPLSEGMPSDQDLLFASVENTEFKKEG